MPLYISKSRYCSAVQCPKMLWLRNNKPEEFDQSVMNEAVLTQGNEVGDLAMGLFGHYVEVPYGKPAEMIEATSRLMHSGEKVIAEASFAYEGQFCSVDLLLLKSDKEVEICEVKSSTSLHDIYLHDTAFQTYVLEQLGYHVLKVCVVHINTSYVRHGELDLQQLFTMKDVTEDVRSLQAETASRVCFLETYLQQKEEPEQRIGRHCTTPYACGFWNYCTRSLPRPNVFDLVSVQTGTKFKNYDNGIITFTDIEKLGKLNAGAMMQVRHELHDIPAEIDRPKIRAFLDSLTFPLFFLDFESFQSAVPPYDDTHPYQQIVFQYSLHYLESPDSELKHTEYLAYPGQDPRRSLAEQLCRDIPADVCVLAYNMTFEKGRIKELAELYPDLAGHLMSVHDNIRDLMVPFREKQYYNRRMQGSYSIKYVLPALFPDDPALDYHNLEGVHNGSEASDTFRRMAGMEPEELEEWRARLLRYCGLDTFAMVRVWQKLCEAVRNEPE